MLHFVTKQEYWSALDRGIENKIKQIEPWHLKAIQDVVVADNLEGLSGLDIAEVGGGDTRLLEWLAKNNTVYNIEPFQGAGNGPIGKIKHKGVTNIDCVIGASEEHIKDETFDVIFSISVVEHIETKDMENFVEDCWRILKPGGKMIHAVDMYLGETNDPQPGNYNIERLKAYNGIFLKEKFEPLKPVEVQPNLIPAFSPSFVTNPDSMMWRWNKVVPQLSKLRAKAQSTSLLWGARKID